MKPLEISGNPKLGGERGGEGQDRGGERDWEEGREGGKRKNIPHPKLKKKIK